jgi:hypothetical protein
MPLGNGLTLRCRVIPSATEYAFDWDDTVAAYPTVKAGGDTTHIRINGSPPAALQVNDRIQIANTGSGAPAVPEQRTVTVIDTVTINPDTILTISSAVTVYPDATNTIYAGGPVVDDIAEAILAEVDALGPSRASGYANASDVWNDTLYLDAMRRAALDATDTDGTRYIASTVAGGVTIDGAAADVTAIDATTDPPEILWARTISVTR